MKIQISEYLIWNIHVFEGQVCNFFAFFEKICKFLEMLILQMVLNGFYGSSNDEIYDLVTFFLISRALGFLIPLK